MNVFNRVVVILLLLGLIALVVLMLAWPLATLAVMRDGLSVAEQNIEGYIRWGAVVLGLLSVVLLVLEFRRPGSNVVAVENVEGGQADLTTESIGRRVSWHVDRLADVIDVKPRVRSRSGGVEVTLDVEASPEIEVPMKTQEILEVVRDQVEDKMGLKLVKNEVKFRLARHPAGPEFTRQAGLPLPPAAPAPDYEAPAEEPLSPAAPSPDYETQAEEPLATAAPSSDYETPAEEQWSPTAPPTDEEAQGDESWSPAVAPSDYETPAEEQWSPTAPPADEEAQADESWSPATAPSDYDTPTDEPWSPDTPSYEDEEEEDS